MDISNTDIRKFQEAIKEYSEYDFSDYSANSLKRRLSKIIGDYGFDIDRLIRTICSDSIALEEIIKKITVNTTELFRDPKIWQSILSKMLPRFRKHSSIHIWHAGCSTGQEVYSMMILLDQLGMLEQSNIYASDINSDVLNVARQGNYRLSFNREYITNFNEVFSQDNQEPEEKSYFPIEKYLKINETRDRIQMHEFLKNKPIYNKIDLVKDDNLFFVNFDIIMCRNVIIYFNYELQNKVLNLFHRNMRDNGCLVLGRHESIIGPVTNLFPKEGHFYSKRKM